LLLRNFYRAKAGQMIGHKLAIEQFKTAQTQPRHKPSQCNFGRIARSGEHAFAAKNPAHSYAI
jgi:hypothetical protein